MATKNLPVVKKYYGNGETVQFPIPFEYISEDYVCVYLKRESQEQIKLAKEQYTFINEATIGFPVLPKDRVLAKGDILVIQRETELGSPFQFDNQKQLFPEVAMRADDRSFHQIQELARDNARCLKMKETDEQTAEEFVEEIRDHIDSTATLKEDILREVSEVIDGIDLTVGEKLFVENASGKDLRKNDYGYLMLPIGIQETSVSHNVSIYEKSFPYNEELGHLQSYKVTRTITPNVYGKWWYAFALRFEKGLKYLLFSPDFSETIEEPDDEFLKIQDGVYTDDVIPTNWADVSNGAIFNIYKNKWEVCSASTSSHFCEWISHRGSGVVSDWDIKRTDALRNYGWDVVEVTELPYQVIVYNDSFIVEKSEPIVQATLVANTQVGTPWYSVRADEDILDKGKGWVVVSSTGFGRVAATGNYVDLYNKPTIPSVDSINSLIDAKTGAGIVLGFEGTLSGNTLTFTPEDVANYNLNNNYDYEIDLYFSAVGVLSDDVAIVIKNGADNINIRNVLSEGIAATYGDLRQLCKYDTQTGWRWVFNARYKEAGGIKAFVIPATSVALAQDLTNPSEHTIPSTKAVVDILGSIENNLKEI